MSRTGLLNRLKSLVKAIPPLRRPFRELEMLRGQGWMPPGHYYSPIPGAVDVERADALARKRRTMGFPGLRMDAEEQLAFVRQISAECRESTLPERPTAGARYYSDNVWFEVTDAAIARAMLSHFRPGRLIEVGCGFSSALLLDAIDLLGLETECTFIDPEPDRLGELLTARDVSRHRFIEREVQEVPLEVFEELERNDVLLVDSSHVAKIGSDVNVIVFDVLPRLAPGVVVHFHDVFYPFEYPREWTLEGRAWNEAYVLRALLMDNDRLRILVFADLLATLHTDDLRECVPVEAGRRTSSLWLLVTDRE